MTTLACIFLVLFLIAHLIGIVANLLMMPDWDFPIWFRFFIACIWELAWIVVFLVYFICLICDWKMAKWQENSHIKCSGQFVVTAGERNCICSYCCREAPADLVDTWNEVGHQTESPEWIKFKKTIRYRVAHFFLDNCY